MLASIPASIFNVVWKLGSTGGLVYLANIFRNRVRVRVRLLAEDFYSDSPPSVKFEAENIGMTPTSIEPIVHFRGYLPRPQGEKQKFKTRMELYELVLHLDGHQRSLEPFKPLPFEVKNEKVSRNVSAKLGFMFFKTYTFSFTRGRRRRIHIRSADGVPLSSFRYWFERVDFKIRGVNSLPKPEEPAYLDD